METWFPVPELEGYEASSLGRVRRIICNILEGNIRIHRRCPDYKTRLVGIKKHGKYRIMNAAHLVCSAFHGARPNGMYCLHKNGDPLDNRPENLEWGTQKENMRHSAAQGRAKPPPRIAGPKHYASKLTTEQVRYIRAQPYEHGLHASLGRKFKVSQSTISKIRANINRIEG